MMAAEQREEPFETPPSQPAGMQQVFSFEQIILSTLRMVRMHWKVSTCFFMQLDDKGVLRIRGADGLSVPGWQELRISPSLGVAGRCVGSNEITETNSLPPSDDLAILLNSSL